MTLLTALVPLLALAQGETYLSRQEAIDLVFDGGQEVLVRTLTIDPEVQALVSQRCGAVPETWEILVGRKAGRIEGYAMILTEVTKTLPARFIVGMDPEGEVTKVAVLSHEEHVGGDCRKERFLRQYRGLGPDANLKVGGGGGLLPVSGATMSCNAVSRAVRKALLVVRHQLILQPAKLAPLLQQAEETVRKRFLMGSFCTIRAAADPAVIERAFDAMVRVEKAVSNYDEKSELSRLHRERSLEAGPDLLEFVTASRRAHEASGGAFDPTVAPLVRLWGFKDGQPRVPSDAELAAVLGRVGFAKVRVEGKRITLPEGVELDPGAIGKGQGVDAAVKVLRDAGVARGLVDFGSTVYAIGRREVGVRSPFDESKLLGVVVLQDEALSTSGNYEKFFEADGKIYGHILDPRTGRPASAAAGATVVAPTGAESDAGSTALFVKGRLEGTAAGLLVRPDRSVEVSEALAGRFRRESP